MDLGVGPGRGKGASEKVTEVFKSWVNLRVWSVCPPHASKHVPGLVVPEGTLRHSLIYEQAQKGG